VREHVRAEGGWVGRRTRAESSMAGGGALGSPLPSSPRAASAAGDGAGAANRRSFAAASPRPTSAHSQAHGGAGASPQKRASGSAASSSIVLTREDEIIELAAHLDQQTGVSSPNSSAGPKVEALTEFVPRAQARLVNLQQDFEKSNRAFSELLVFLGVYLSVVAPNTGSQSLTCR
jgi:hypothetical protein